MHRRNAAVAAGTALAAFGLMTAGAGSAQASALAFTSKGCIPQGASVVECYADVTGGTAPYSWYWSDNPTYHYSDESARCTTNQINTVTVRVTDATGAYVTANISFYCYGGPPR